MAEPAHFPNNPIVQHLLEVQRINAERGAPAGRNYAGGGPVDAGIPTRVSSAAMHSEVPVPRILSTEERAERDRAARELGIMPPEDDANDAYPDLEAAMAAGESVKKPEPEADPMLLRRNSIIQDQMRDSPVPFSQASMYASPIRSRLVDFRRLQSIDLMRNVAVVDDFEIEVPDEIIRVLKKQVLELAVDYVTRQLAQALSEVLSGGGEASLSAVRGIGDLSVESETTAVPVSDVRPDEAASDRSETTPNPSTHAPEDGELPSEGSSTLG